MPFKKGQIGNPKGRPKGSTNKRAELLTAIKYVQSRKDPATGKTRKKLLVHAVEQAYVDNAVLVAIMRKLIPDMKSVELAGADGTPLVAQVRVKLVSNDIKAIEHDGS